MSRFGPGSCLIDAATNRTVQAEELPRLIAAYSASLRAAGLRKGDRLLIGSTLSPATVVVYLAAIYAGLVAVPVEDRLLASSLDILLETTGARALWSEEGLRVPAPGNSSVLRLQGELAAAPGEWVPPAPCHASELAVLMATSGSTGIPRFVMVSHQNLIANTEAIVGSQRLAGDERAMLVLPVSYVFGASILHTHLYQGGSVVLDRRFMFPDKVLQAIVQFGCTTFAGVPTVYNVLLRRSSFRETAMPSLRRFLQAGGALAAERIDEIRACFPEVDFYAMYGQTEATARISCLEPERWADKPGSVGRPLDNLTVSIVDERGHAVAPGEVGELVVRGPSICSGYWNDPEESRGVFSGSGLRTGDLARQDAEGYLWIVGRKGAFLKMRGTRVSLVEVEERVAAIPGVFECAACAVPHPEAGEALALFVVTDPEVEFATQDLPRSLPAHWAVDSVRLVSELPKTAAGKLARASLQSWLGEPSCNSLTR